jgi:hypothetical protein
VNFRKDEASKISHGDFPPFLSCLRDFFEIITSDIPEPKETSSIYNMIDYDIFAKLIR